jgi:hypothetical protein
VAAVAFAGSVVEFGGDLVEVVGGVCREVGAFRDVLVQKAVDVLVAAALRR